MHLLIPAFVASLVAITKDDTEVCLKQTTTESGVTLLSIDGQFDDVQQFAMSQNWDPAAIVADGDNATQLDDNATQDSLWRQMIVITDAGGQTLTEAQASITKAELSELKDQNLTFGHFVAAFNENVDVAGWADNYQGKWSQYATSQRFAFYIDADTRTIRNSATGEKTVLLIGDEGTRTLLGQLSGNDGSYKVITSDFDKDTQVRQDITADYLVEVKYGGDTVNAVSAQNLALYFQGKIDDLAWAQTSVGSDIEEISGINGQNVVLLTLKGSEYRYVPATIAIEDGKLAVIPSTQNAVKVQDFGDDTVGAPIARSSKNGSLVMVDRNGSDNVVNFSSPAALDNKSYGPAMKKMLDAAHTGLSAAA